MNDIKISHEDDVKNVSLNLDGIGINEIKDDVTFSIDTLETSNNTINLDTNILQNSSPQNAKKEVDVGLDLLANPKKQMRNDSSDDDAGRVVFNNSDK